MNASCHVGLGEKAQHASSLHSHLVALVVVKVTIVKHLTEISIESCGRRRSSSVLAVLYLFTHLSKVHGKLYNVTIARCLLVADFFLKDRITIVPEITTAYESATNEIKSTD
jgi:hypothetical protein